MNKTLALIAALGLVVSAPTFAAPAATTTTDTTAAAADTATPEASSTEKTEKKAEATQEEKGSKKHMRHLASKKKISPENASKLNPAAGGSDKSDKPAATGSDQ